MKIISLVQSAVIGICGFATFAFFDLDANASQKVHIGLASNFSQVSTGDSNPYGDYFRQGVQLAIREYQKRLSSSGVEIVLDEFDYGTNQIDVLKAARRAAESNVVAVLGYNYSSHALLAGPIHQEAKLPMITPSATALRIGKMGSYVHQGCFDNGFMGRALARIAFYKLRARKVAMIPAGDCAYCQDLSQEFEKEFAALGGVIVANVSVLDKERDFSKVVNELKGRSFDAILLPNQELNSARVISALVKANINKPFLGGDGWGNVGAEFFAILAGDKFSGYSLSHWHEEMNSPDSVMFKTKYRKEFGKTPNDTSVLAYDSMSLLLTAVLNAKDISREGLERAIREIRNFSGITGKFVFRNGAAPEKSLVLLKAGQGKFKVLETIAPGALGARSK